MAFIITSIKSIIIGILLFNNKCTWLISAYNILSEEEKRIYDIKKLSRFISYLMFVISICILVFPIGDYLGNKHIIEITTIIIIVISIGSVIYCNTGNRLKK